MEGERERGGGSQIMTATQSQTGKGMWGGEEKRGVFFFFPGDIWLWLSGAVWKGQPWPFVLTGLMGGADLSFCCFVLIASS